MELITDKLTNAVILQDHVLAGGTKSIFIEDLLDKTKDYHVYASPVYGGFQIALSIKCELINRKAVIFCAKRNIPHKNTLLCKEHKATIYQVKAGYLNVVQSKAREFCNKNNGQFLVFGANCELAINKIADRMQSVIKLIGYEPDIIYCPVGSGTLAKGILKGTKNSKIIGVQVGKNCDIINRRFNKFVYPLAFDKECPIKTPFISSENYDAKCYHKMLQDFQSGITKDKTIFMWNVY